MKLPFSIDEFLSVFEKYNLSIWPGQIILNAVAIFLIVSLFKQWQLTNRIILYGLGFFWLWMGVMYHIVFFSPINPAARLFGILFIIQSVVFFYLGAKEKMSFHFAMGLSGSIGMILLVYAIILYPFLGYAFGHELPKAPSFGVPCPTTIFTFGILMFSKERIPWYFILIPFLWSLVGFSAALNLKIFEDYGLVIAGLIGFSSQLFFKHHSLKLADHK